MNESSKQSMNFHAPVGNVAGNVAGDQIQGDSTSTYNINNIRIETHNQLLEERVEKLQADLINFKQELKNVILLAKTFSNSIKEIIENLEPDENETKLKLLSSLRQSFKYLNSLQDIGDSIKACQEASIWLSNKRKKLVGEAQCFVAKENFELKIFNKVLAGSEQIEQFGKDIDMYLFWIGHHMAMGREPTPLPEGAIALSLPVSVYLETFNLIINETVCIKEGLSKEAFIELSGYLSCFVITPLSQLDSCS